MEVVMKGKISKANEILISILMISGFLLSGCSSTNDHRFTTPYEYYLYVPKNYTSARSWPLFIGIHGSGQSGKDCWNTWQSFADENGFVLLCPSLSDPALGGGWMLDDGERKLNAILTEIWPNYSLKSKYFLAGFSAGAFFVQGYAYHYPTHVAGLSIISAGNFYSEIRTGLKSTPIMITVGEQDTQGVKHARVYFNSISANGFNASFYIIEGVGHSISKEAKEMTIKQYVSIFGRP